MLRQLNYYRLEAGRFEDFVSYGLKSFAHEGFTKTRLLPLPDTIPTWSNAHATVVSCSIVQVLQLQPYPNVLKDSPEGEGFRPIVVTIRGQDFASRR